MRLYFAFLLSVCMLPSFYTPASAQLSIMVGAAHSRYVEQSKDMPSFLGVSMKLAVDLGKKSQIALAPTWHFPVNWVYSSGLGVLDTSVGTYLPKRVQSVERSFEVTGLYTYFILGDNVSKASLYASGGPGMVLYKVSRSQMNQPDLQEVHNITDYVVDMRAGGAVNIYIGWMYAEARLAPRLFETGDGVTDRGLLWGLNAGLRFLLNEHPRCKE